jgi:hypothetical protein
MTVVEDHNQHSEEQWHSGQTRPITIEYEYDIVGRIHDSR